MGPFIQGLLVGISSIQKGCDQNSLRPKRCSHKTAQGDLKPWTQVYALTHDQHQRHESARERWPAPSKPVALMLPQAVVSSLDGKGVGQCIGTTLQWLPLDPTMHQY